MNRAEKLRTVLADGRPHSRQDIFDKVGFMLTNNAASELRSAGCDVQQWRDGGIYIYQLKAPGPATQETPSSPRDDGAGPGALSWPVAPNPPQDDHWARRDDAPQLTCSAPDGSGASGAEQLVLVAA